MCCTCIEAVTPRLQQAVTVSLCIVDAAHGACEPEILLPVCRAKHALLLQTTHGDTTGENSQAPLSNGTRFGVEVGGSSSDHCVKSTSSASMDSFFKRHQQHVMELGCTY